MSGGGCGKKVASKARVERRATHKRLGNRLSSWRGAEGEDERFVDGAALHGRPKDRAEGDARHAHRHGGARQPDGAHEVALKKKGQKLEENKIQ